MEHKAAARDTIGIAADGDAEIIGLVDIARKVVIAEYDVRDRPRAVGGFERLKRRAIGDDTRLHPRFIGERDRLDGPRSEESRVGNEGVRTGWYWGAA